MLMINATSPASVRRQLNAIVQYNPSHGVQVEKVCCYISSVVARLLTHSYLSAFMSVEDSNVTKLVSGLL